MRGRGRPISAANSQHANPVTILGNQWCACRHSRQMSSLQKLHEQITVSGIQLQWPVRQTKAIVPFS